jgi:Domain of unknown function (DUF4136)
MKSVVAILSLALLLAGCESSMQAEVTQFSGAAPLPAGRNFVVSAEPTQSGSLEFQHYAGLVGGALQDHGFKAAPPGATADLVVLIHYGSAGNHTELLSDPAWGWGGGWRHRGGSPFGPDAESKTYYGEMLEVEIFDGAAWRNNVRTMLYQGRAVGDATVNEISAAVPALVKALFTHFPGNSGQTERVMVPLPAPAGAA